MDPNETVSMLLAAIGSGKMGEAAEHATSLVDWTRKGGFYPAAIDPIALCEAVIAHEEQ